MAFRRAGAGKRRGGGDYGDGQKRQRTMASLLTPEDKLGMPLETIIGAWRVLGYIGLDWLGSAVRRRKNLPPPLAADRIRRGGVAVYVYTSISTYPTRTPPPMSNSERREHGRLGGRGRRRERGGLDGGGHGQQPPRVRGQPLVGHGLAGAQGPHEAGGRGCVFVFVFLVLLCWLWWWAEWGVGYIH